MLLYSVPPGYRRRERPASKKLGPQTAWIDAILEADRGVHKKQRHTAQRIFERLRDERVPFTTVGSELLFEVFSQRYERGATLVTSNLPFDEWTSVFGSPNTWRCHNA